MMRWSYGGGRTKSEEKEGKTEGEQWEVAR